GEGDDGGAGDGAEAPALTDRATNARYSKNGNSFASSSFFGRRPYSQISKASACWTFAAASLPYQSASMVRKRSARERLRAAKFSRTCLRRASCLPGSLGISSAEPSAPPSKNCDSSVSSASSLRCITLSMDTAMSGVKGLGFWNESG